MNWTPPENPDPDKILDEAVEDTRNENYDVALQKLLWFHEHALSIRPSLSGVRLSFALGYWYELGERYPPAREKMIEVRDAAVTRCREQEFPFEAFKEVCAFNRKLDQSHLSVELFLEAEEKFPESAKTIYHVAKDSLIEAERYDVCNPYLDADKRFQFVKRIYDETQQMNDEHPLPGEDDPYLANRFFIRRIGTLIGLLVKNGRGDEAEAVKAKALEVMDNEKIRRVIDGAMSGILPEQP